MLTWNAVFFFNTVLLCLESFIIFLIHRPHDKIQSFKLLLDPESGRRKKQRWFTCKLWQISSVLLNICKEITVIYVRGCKIVAFKGGFAPHHSVKPQGLTLTDTTTVSEVELDRRRSRRIAIPDLQVRLSVFQSGLWL